MLAGFKALRGIDARKRNWIHRRDGGAKGIVGLALPFCRVKLVFHMLSFTLINGLEYNNRAKRIDLLFQQLHMRSAARALAG